MSIKEEFSLLYPHGCAEDNFNLEDQVIKDLEVEYFINFLVPDRLMNKLQYESIKKVILSPCKNERVIKYRQEITADLLFHREIFNAFERLGSLVESLSYYRAGRFSQQSFLYALVYRIGELESYIYCVDTLKRAFENSNLAQQSLSEGLMVLYRHINDLYADEDFMHMKSNLPELAAIIRNNRSVTVGLNLDDDMKPVEASLIGINKISFSEKSTSLFNKLIRKDSEGISGLAPLHSKDEPLMGALFSDLSDVMKRICVPIQKALNRYIKINTGMFINIKDELIFYTSGVNLLLRLKEKGMAVCKPDIRPADDREIFIENNYNINLFIRLYRKNSAINDELVPSNVLLNDNGRIVILTGPNQGGKTVYTQAIGLSQILFQIGLFVPGSRARMSPVDNIFTHFQIEEHIMKETGRFADEAKRLNSCVKAVTSHSLILMNESFASTNYEESLYIASDVMRIFRILGVRVVFATHFHELARRVDEINEAVTGSSKLFSMVASVREARAGEGIRRTYCILPGPPAGKSYARDIALRYEICFEQLLELLQGRKVLV